MACKRTSELAVIVLALAACTPSAPERFVSHPPQLATLRLRVPAGVVTSYDVVVDCWHLASATEHAVLDVAPAASTAGPDALRHALEVERRTPSATFTIETRESLSDGFSTTLSVRAASDPTGAIRTTYVVRELGNQWIRCVGSSALCKSLKRG